MIIWKTEMEKEHIMTVKDETVALVTDLHIGSHQNSKLWYDITLKFAQEFKERLKADNIKDIIICGDIHDDRTEISVQSLDVTNKLFTMWKDFNIIIIVGNHDAYYKNRSDVNSLSLFSGWDNITVIDKPLEYKVFGKNITFCPWGTNIDLLHKCDYIFGHFEINGFNLSKTTVCTKGLVSSNLLNKTDTVISGHFHLPASRKYKNGKIIYLGSPYELDWGDCGTEPRGFYYFNIPTGKLDFIPSQTSPKHKKIRFSEITSAGVITDDIKKEFAGNFVNFIVDQDIKHPEKFNEYLSVLDNLGAISIKTEYLLEDRISMDETEYDFDTVDIKSSINEFLKITDYNNKEELTAELYTLYDKCKKETHNE